MSPRKRLMYVWSSLAFWGVGILISALTRNPLWSYPGAIALIFAINIKDTIDVEIAREPHLEIWPARKRIGYALGAAVFIMIAIVAFFAPDVRTELRWIIGGVAFVCHLIVIHMGMLRYRQAKREWTQ